MKILQNMLSVAAVHHTKLIHCGFVRSSPGRVKNKKNPLFEHTYVQIIIINKLLLDLTSMLNFSLNLMYDRVADDISG